MDGGRDLPSYLLISSNSPSDPHQRLWNLVSLPLTRSPATTVFLFCVLSQIMAFICSKPVDGFSSTFCDSRQSVLSLHGAIAQLTVLQSPRASCPPRSSLRARTTLPQDTYICLHVFLFAQASERHSLIATSTRSWPVPAASILAFSYLLLALLFVFPTGRIWAPYKKGSSLLINLSLAPRTVAHSGAQ